MKPLENKYANVVFHHRQSGDPVAFVDPQQLANAFYDLHQRVSKLEAVAAKTKDQLKSEMLVSIKDALSHVPNGYYAPTSDGRISWVSFEKEGAEPPKAEPAPETRGPGWYWVWWAEGEERQPAELQRMFGGLTWCRPGVGYVETPPWRIGSRIQDLNE